MMIIEIGADGAKLDGEEMTTAAAALWLALLTDEGESEGE